MREDTVVRFLNQFDLQEYIASARANGRANIEPRLREVAAESYQKVVELRQGEFVFSFEVQKMLDFAERVLFAEWYFHHDPTPRYPVYTNVRVLNWCLGTNKRSTSQEIWSNCWTTLKLLLEDLASFEACSLVGIEDWQQDNKDEVAIKRRIAGLRDIYLNNIKDARPINHLLLRQKFPKNWDEYALDASHASSLMFVTALPQTKEHDEYLFLRTIHMSEVCFWGILTSILSCMESIKHKEFDSAKSHLQTGVAFADILVPLFQAFKTMSPEHFTNFRDATGNASAIQSRTYQLVQIFSQGLDERKAPIMTDIPEVSDLTSYGHPMFMSLKQILKLVEDSKLDGVKELIDEANYLDKSLYAWRCLHLGIAREYLPSQVIGTGGTSGASYLATHYRRKIFPLNELLPVNEQTKLLPFVARPIFSDKN